MAVDESDQRLRRERSFRKGGAMLTILLVVVVLMLLGVMPTWPHSRGWGYYPSGGLGLVLLVLVILMLSGRL
jgi:Protein of unknown function (DUF3309)